MSMWRRTTPSLLFFHLNPMHAWPSEGSGRRRERRKLSKTCFYKYFGAFFGAFTEATASETWTQMANHLPVGEQRSNPVKTEGTKKKRKKVMCVWLSYLDAIQTNQTSLINVMYCSGRILTNQTANPVSLNKSMLQRCTVCTDTPVGVVGGEMLTTSESMMFRKKKGKKKTQKKQDKLQQRQKTLW